EGFARNAAVSDGTGVCAGGEGRGVGWVIRASALTAIAWRDSEVTKGTIMVIVRIEHAVPDFAKWKQMFDSDPADRKGSGVGRYQILRSHEDPDYVLIDLEFNSIDEAEAFVRKMQQLWGGPGKAVMQHPRATIAEVFEV